MSTIDRGGYGIYFTSTTDVRYVAKHPENAEHLRMDQVAAKRYYVSIKIFVLEPQALHYCELIATRRIISL